MGIGQQHPDSEATIAPVSGAPAAKAKRQRPSASEAKSPPPAPLAPPASILTEAQRQTLKDAAFSAAENNAVTHMSDGANRDWFVGVDIVNNHSAVLIQARRGALAVGRHLSTATLSREAVSQAIAEIDSASEQ